MSERILPFTIDINNRLESKVDRQLHLESIPFDGRYLAHDETKEDIIDEIVLAGDPVDNLRRITTSQNTKENPTARGSYGFGEFEGLLNLYKSRESIPPIARLGVIKHEMAHANSPLFEANSRLYGSPEARKDAEDHAIKVADQTILSGKYLNGYHKYHHDLYIKKKFEYESGQISRTKFNNAKWLFVEETHAIMSQLRYENPKHLKEVQTAQHEEMARLGKTPVYLMSHRDDNGSLILDGIDKALINRMPDVNSYNELEDHIAEARAYYQEKYGAANSRISPIINLRQRFSPFPQAA